ncbi:MAG TPA: hypothetical protein VFP89_03540 [Propionibacteriaceae bacterium]|nr:hypothetical protein [Propionibacteriaceae bacterium]
MTTDNTFVPPLAPGSRLLHIGIPKTGTTALQTAAAQHRSELARNQVCYPGRSGNHREAVCALMGRQLGWTGAGEYVPDIRLWERLVAEVERHPNMRAFISHEFASECDEEQAGRFRASLGDSIHVVITLRGFAWLLSSSWQQYVKAGRRQSFDRWLRDILADTPDTRAALGFYKRNDQGAVVDRWVRVMGADRVTVVIADKKRPHQLTDAFEDMLGLPRGLLKHSDGGGLAANRSLSLPEAELIRRVNSIVRKHGLSWQQFTALIRNGTIARLLEGRRPAGDETRIALPRWAAEKATTKARTYADAVSASRCRVIGDISTLYAPIPPAGDTVPKVENVPIDVAVEAVAGLLSAATGQGAFFDLDSRLSTPGLDRLGHSKRGRHWLQLNQVTADSSVTDLLAVAGLRAASRVRDRFGR